MAVMSNTRRAKPTIRAARGDSVHTVKVTLRDSSPPIWRRLEVPSRCTLAQLHQVIQRSFGWQDYHMWDFETPQGRFGVADRDLDIRSAAAQRLDQVAPQAGARLRYTYDFGDNWEHDLLVESVAPAEPGTAYPRCLTGRRAGPPEDCGGIWGYQELIAILGDPRHEEHDERLEWLGFDTATEFDPAAFDLARTDAALSDLATVLVQSP
jgi:hypothetical protein